MAGFPFSRLLELARNELDEAARVMQAEQQRLLQQQTRLDQLTGYLADYRQRLNDSQQRGMTVNQWRDFQSFMVKLDQALAQQREEVSRAEHRAATAREAWSARRQKVKAFEALEVRHLEIEAQHERKREQKLLDEFANRASFHARYER